MKTLRFVLPIIVLAQFCCTSLWFAGNGVMNNLITDYNLNSSALGHLTALVQFGFIIGTLVFAIFSLADRYSPSHVFFFSAVLAASFNLGILWDGNSMASLLCFRFFTGFFLAGIYPVGMKIAADYYQKGLGKALGFLVGALVIGTALPHLLKELTHSLPWKSVIIATSSLAICGGLSMFLFVADGPYRKAAQQVDLANFWKVFQNRKLRTSAFGYFGHMWELYAFWAFAPLMLETYKTSFHSSLSVPLLSFAIIGIGGLSCVMAGYLSACFGTKRTAIFALFLSCCCCLTAPWLLTQESKLILITFLLVWGMAVIADSPLFSTLVAQNTAPETKGTALTIVNCIGFAITIVSIQLINSLRTLTESTTVYALLALGPILGLWALLKTNNSKA